MFKSIKYLQNGINEVIFPKTCLVCGIKLSQTEHFVCPNCITNRFEIANGEGNQSSSDTLLPEGVILQHALWNFDKGGYLQELLHALKYQRLTGIGIDLGIALGMSVIKNPFFSIQKNMVLVPVPLHPNKNRTRGYNQAMLIAEGVQKSTGIPICLDSDIIRIKNTKTQTGFTLEKRRQNIDNAFKVENETAIKDKICIIVDDVFTTGATAFELSDTLLKAGAIKNMIITVAQA